MEDAGESELLVTDVLGRCGRFDDAREQCEEGLRSNPDDLLRKLLEYEGEPVAGRDTRCRDAGEAIQRPE